MMADTNTETKATHGGKGATLMHLQELGYPVPQFLVLPVSFFSSNDDDDTIRGKCAKHHNEWTTFFGNDALLAVRSSAIGEDGGLHSFAGQFTSLLNVPVKDVADAVIRVVRSAGNERATAYRQLAGNHENNGMAVILQRMIPATAAGVGFGINPVSGADEIVINAVQGLGDKLVDGTINGDTYVLKEGTIITRKPVTEAVLSDVQLYTIAKCIQSLNAHFDKPQDIEFAIADNEFYLLQSRPVTAVAHGERIIWDNSNIVESYPGLTQPLTFSFIEKMYEAVYRQFALVLGVSQKVVSRNEKIYANMLGLLNGRVYYNLNSWYRALAQLPGYSLNASFMEKMMGVKEKPDVDVSAQINASRLASWKDLAVAGYRIISNLRAARKERDHFIRSFHNIYDPYSKMDFSRRTLAEIWAGYERFETLMIKEWKAPLANDLFAMIYFGLLQKQCAKYSPGDSEIHNRLLSGSDDIVTTEPLKRLPLLAAKLASNPALKKACEQEDAAVVWRMLQETAYTEIRAEIEAYISDWGERAVAELKLETITYKQDPVKLIAMLQSYISNKIFSFKKNGNAAEERANAELEMLNKLKGKPVKRRIFRHILAQARYFVSNRENLRYYRTRAFGMVRILMLACGEQLRKSGHLQNARDVFYLTLDELKPLAAGQRAMQETVALRKEEYEMLAELPLPQRIKTAGKPKGTILIETEAPTYRQDTSLLKGTPCSGGVVRSKVYRVHHASALQSLNGGILATYATDPGYVVLFATATGILTERGSLLSHAAIVSREMGIPCIVGIEGLMDNISDGDELLMDGSTGIVKILKRT